MDPVEAYKNAIVAVATALKEGPYRHVLFDVQNEFLNDDISGEVKLTEDKVREIVAAVHSADDQRIAVGSSGWNEGTDFGDVVAYHDPRTLVPSPPALPYLWFTEDAIRTQLDALRLSLVAKYKPVYYQEPMPFRPFEETCGSPSDSTSTRTRDAAKYAKRHGAAAWTFHTRQSFSLGPSTLKALLDADIPQRDELAALRASVDAEPWGVKTSLRSTHDFNSDGKPDLLWLNDGTNRPLVWYMQGMGGDRYQGWNQLAPTTPLADGWKVVTTADFNQDGHPDLVWHNKTTLALGVWYLNGAGGNEYLGWANLAPTATSSPGYFVVGSGDFNGDTKPDLVWQNPTTLDTWLWYLGGVGGAEFLGFAQVVGATSAPGWYIIGVDDFNNDKVSDLVWQNPTTLASGVWRMGGTGGSVFQGWYTLAEGVSSAPGWYIIGTDDLNSDGRPDLVWQNPSTLASLVWYMGDLNGNTWLGWKQLATTQQSAPGWTLRMR